MPLKRGERRGNCGERRGSDVAPSGLLLRWENEYSYGSGWLYTLTNGTPYSIDSLSSGCSTFDLYAHHLHVTVASGESVYSIAHRRYLMNSKDCGVTAAKEYMYIAALIAAVSLFRIHCHMAGTVLEIPTHCQTN